MPDIQKYLGNAAVVSGRITAPVENEPGQYSDRGYPYFNVASTRFYQEYAKYASDYFVGVEAQGLNPNNQYEWETITLRMADLVKTSAAMQRQFDNHKMVLLDKMKYAYVPRGAKFVVMGSVWLCTNPENISGGDGIGVIQRCNAVWRHLDWYGNVLAEPIVVETDILRANAPDPQYNMPIVKGYFNVKCQFNQWTAQIDDNTRMILGSSCYVVTGFSDFFQEFTGNDCSVRMLEFTIRKDEVDRTIDDMYNKVAGGLNFSWDILLEGDPIETVGNSFTCSAKSIRDGVEVASDDEEHPFGYVWSSDDETIATVDETGLVTAIAEGTCNIKCTLDKNDEVWAEWPLTVAQPSTGNTVDFLTVPPEKLNAFGTATITAACITDGEEVPDTVEWSFSGADEDAYTANKDGNTVLIACWKGSVEPLMVTASWNGESVSVIIKLEGI